MAQKFPYEFCTRFAIALPFVLLGTRATLAQIAPDATLPNDSIVTPHGNTFAIDGGTTAGANLFHSFSEFSVPTDATAVFNNAIGIDNIITRVTGGSISNIDGLIRANGTANLFLLNANGIVFGENARLDVGGSVIASSADRLLFDDGSEFNTVGAVREPPLLSVNVPIGLQFDAAIAPRGAIQINGSGRQRILFDETARFPNVNSAFAQRLQATIATEGNGLTVRDRGSVALIGREILFDGGGLQLPGGNVAIASVTEGQTDLTGNPLGNSEGNVTFGDVRLQNAAAIDTSGTSSGDVRLRGKNVILEGGSIIFARPLAGGTGSEVIVDAAGAIAVRDSAIVGGTLGAARGTHLRLRGGEIAVTEGGFLSATSFSTGDGGDIDLEAGTIEIRGANGNNALSAVFADAAGAGSGGTVRFRGDRLRVADGGQVTARAFASGRGSDIHIDATDITLSESRTSGSSPFAANISRDRFPSGLFALVEADASGDGGNIDIQTRAIALVAGGQIEVNTLGAGRGGNLTIRASESVDIVGASANGLTRSSVSGVVEPGATGDGGRVAIETGDLRVLDTAFISVTTFGAGDAGDLMVRADTIELQGASATNELIFGGLFAEVRGPDRISVLGLDGEAEGNGGDLTLEAGQVRILDGAHISVLTDSTGDGGNLNITADRLEIAGVVEVPGAAAENPPFTRATVSAGTEETGMGGTVAIATRELFVRDGGRVSVSTEGTGNAGNLTLQATEAIEVSGTRFASGISLPASISASSPATGNAGTLRLETGELRVRDGAEISVSSQEAGLTGDLEVSAETIRLQDGGRLSAESVEGSSGNIRLETDLLLLLDSSLVTTNASRTATGGNITIDADAIAARANGDITANAEEGFGGRVTVRATGIFGTAFRERPTPQSDITATSELGPSFGGVVEINQPEVDPGNALVDLSTTFFNALGELDRDPCKNLHDNQFIVIGRGGLPPTPLDAQSIEYDIDAWIAVPETIGAAFPQGSPPAPVATKPIPRTIVEATSWHVDRDGNVELFAGGDIDRQQWHRTDSCNVASRSTKSVAK